MVEKEKTPYGNMSAQQHILHWSSARRFLGNRFTKEIYPITRNTRSVRSIKTRVMPAKLEEITGKALGFMTLSMPWGEIHSALMLGTIDAAMGPVYGEVTLFKRCS